MRLKMSWGAKVGTVSVGMVALLMFVPITTSLGQGIHENIVAGWQGRYDRLSHQYYCRFLMADNTALDIPVTAFPLSLIRPDAGHGEFRVTALDPKAVIEIAYREHPALVEKDLGTRANVADRLSPFPGRPVAYSAAFLAAISRMHWNPRVVGGPDIPPGLVPLGALHAGVLQIDTEADNNTLRQLLPGERPLPLENFRKNDIRR